ncbi:hypothetical protein ENU1_215150 [Entamoeba nuttalli P19]|uniref:MRN complex-interacting protein N-terminal domain-containing protein n=2 Tax=Entamoeba nuttalli TaxID=412467 RepID=K2HM59_ENTNP|nr:hypothetical protein ENU1_215150 [Entamoeba nuttalli P19]EKE36890.1 hypothetical protein ENU1_215150 [Entamoeba nuttalli P19]|eukprot:XP_008860782.1 hypothetical protein ENU1_215150 [Entamoeba nuttalli P19]
MFQVHIKKKTKKFECKVCGAKQSYKHIFGISNQAKDLRQLCGEYNEKRIIEEEQNIEKQVKQKEEEEDKVLYITEEEEQKRINKGEQSIWKEFEEEEVEEGDLYQKMIKPFETKDEEKKRKTEKSKRCKEKEEKQIKRQITTKTQTIKLSKEKEINEEINDIEEILALFDNNSQKIKDEKVKESQENKYIQKPLILKNEENKQTKSSIKLSTILQTLKQTTSQIPEEDEFLFGGNEQDEEDNIRKKTTSIWDDF